MVSIPEQARQVPKNATPYGFDAAEVLFPGVNTCATVTIFGARGLAGLHLGMFMGAGEEGGKGSEDSKMIDNAYLDMYLHVLKLQAYNRASTLTKGKAFKVEVEKKSLDGILVAGAIDVWRASAVGQWNFIKAYLAKIANDNGITVQYYQFDDEQAMTVDIYVQRTGVRFTKVGTQTAVTGQRLMM